MKSIKTTIAALALAISSPAMAESWNVGLTGSVAGSQSGDAKDGHEFKASVGYGSWDVWASYGEQDQVIVSQSAGSLSIIGAGIGYEARLTQGISFYADAGMASIEGSYRERILKEAVWFSFKPTFDQAHWLPDDNYLQEGLEFQADFDTAPLVRLGARFELSDNVSMDVSYRFLNAKQFLSIKDPEMAEANGWWEGSFDRDLSALSLGVSWSF